ncbi:DUF4328 domain-containing protein [Streptomyces sp. NPDC000345]|uniref:DUF4328 domain-containing protein n=1 Tax=Streptomyces sp. NPDC000345 TaxID=3364537 RepID=UPI003691E12C
MLRSPVLLGRATAVLLGLVAATDLFALWAGSFLLDANDAVSFGNGADRFHTADRVYRAAGLAQTVALLATVVVYLCWFHRVRVNAEWFRPDGHRMSRGWAIGGWFTPIVNLWYPRRITVDIWDASSPGAPWERPRSHALVNAWWTLWVLSLLADRAGSRMYARAETPSELHDALFQVMCADGLDLAAAVLAILVVLRLTAMQNTKALQGPPGDPAFPAALTGPAGPAGAAPAGPAGPIDPVGTH